MTIKKSAATLAVLCLVTVCSPGDNRFLSIGTGGTGGIYYPLGGAIANQMSAGNPAMRFTAEVTGGSVENINRVVAGEMDLGFTMATNAYVAHETGGPDSTGLKSLRLVAPLYPNLVQIVVRNGIPIERLEEAAGRRVSVGSAGSGTEQVSKQLLAEHGLTYDDIDARFLSFRESAEALRDGAIDLAIVAAGFPTSAVLEVSTAGLVRLMPIAPEHRASMIESYPYYVDAFVPEGAYPGVDADVPTIAVLNWIVGDVSLDSSVVLLLLETLAERQDDLSRVHVVARQIDLAALGGPTPIPLHPASVSWHSARR